MSQAEVQIVVGFLAPFLLQFVKKSSWFPLLTDRTDKIIKMVWSALVAAGSALAITFVFDPTLGQLTVTGLTWSNIGHGMLTFLVSMISQQVSYRMLINPKGKES